MQALPPESARTVPFDGSGDGNSRCPTLLIRARSLLCALPVQHVVETLRPLAVEPLSGAPPFVRGIAVIRGEAVPVVDLGSLLGIREESNPTRFVTLRLGRRSVALAVEAVLGVRVLEAGVARAVPPLLRDVEDEGLAAVGILDEQLLLVLRAARLVPDALWDTLASAMRGAENGRIATSTGAHRLEGSGPPTAGATREPEPAGQGTA